MSVIGRFQSQRILIVGATGSLGSAIAGYLRVEGAELILSGRDESRLSALSQGLGAQACAVDLSTAAGRAQLVNRMDTVDGVVFAAGVAPVAPVRYLKDSDLEACLSINTVAPLLLTRELLKKKKLNAGASFVWISSVAASRGAAGYAAYAASKAALEAAGRCLALELAPKGMRVNCVAPGMVKTEMADELADRISEDALEAHLHAYPLGLGRPADIAAAVSFLLSLDSRWITGATLPVDGGFLIS